MGVPVCISCGNKRTPGCGIVFHSFPVKDPLRRRWEIAARTEANTQSLICEVHFKKDDYKFSNSKKLKDDAVPSVFNFKPPVNERKPPRKRPFPDDEEKSKKIITNNNEPIPVPVSPTKDDLKKIIDEKNSLLLIQKSKIKVLQQKVRRKEAKIEKLDGLLNDLKDKTLLTPKLADSFSTIFSGLTCEIIRNHFANQERNPRGYRHSDEAKRFATTIHFYSPRAYDYLRKIFCLPCPRSIQAWTSSVECDPGFFKDVFLHLKQMTEKDSVNADCALIFDGMKIRQEILYNISKGRMDGFVDYGKDIVSCDNEEDDDTVATDALIFLLSAFRSHWKYPIGYVLYNKIDADTQVSLVSHALELGQEHGLSIKTVTCDGPITNMSTMKKMGCKIGNESTLLDGEFSFNGQRYLFTPDPPHMLKLARNALSDLGVFVDGDGNEIKWQYIQNLHEEQYSIGLKFGNKLSRRHVFFQRHKMNVKLAAQTLSSSVADAIEFLEDAKDPNFQGASATVKFIRVVDRLFDLLNSRSPNGKGFKAPMRANTRSYWSSVIDHSISYLVNLKDVNGLSLLKHRRSTFVKGMVIAARSARKLADDLLYRKEDPYSYVMNYKWSQDHVELLNASIRGRTGDNPNPNVLQFKSALKKILLHAAMSASKYSNCVTFDNDDSPPIFALKWTKNRSALTRCTLSRGFVM
jgi:hypothetical protein